MQFVDYYGPAELFAATARAIRERVAAVFRAPVDQVVVRRFEVWIEVSAEEQLYRYGGRLAREISDTIRAVRPVDVWVMFRVVPLAHAFLNGAPRRRVASLEE